MAKVSGGAGRSQPKYPFVRTVYRGSREGGPADPGDLGIGTYWSTSLAMARQYGSVSKERVRLTNPIYMDLPTINRWLERYDTLHGSMRQRKAEATRMTNDLRQAGYDGIVATGWDSPEGHSTVVVFPERGCK
jgi:hypothetical protein